MLLKEIADALPEAGIPQEMQRAETPVEKWEVRQLEKEEKQKHSEQEMQK